MVCIVLLIWAMLTSTGFSAGKPLTEYQVKAAYLLKFAAFVEWPERENTPSGTIKIGVIGKDPFGPLLPPEIPADEPEGLSYQVVRLSATDQNLSDFQILYINDPDPKVLATLLSRVAHEPILTVGEGEPFIERGGIISFTLQNNRVRFLINSKKARRSNLRINVQLLSLAKVVSP